MKKRGRKKKEKCSACSDGTFDAPKLGSNMFSKIFQTITVDNGSEFSDYEEMERSIDGGKRTKVFSAIRTAAMSVAVTRTSIKWYVGGIQKEQVSPN